MTYRSDIKSLLAADATVASIVGSHIYWLRAPIVDPGSPYIVLSVVTAERFAHLKGSASQARIRLQVDFFGESYVRLQNLDDAVRTALTSARLFDALHTMSYEFFEDDTRLFHLVSEYSIFHPNP